MRSLKFERPIFELSFKNFHEKIKNYTTLVGTWLKLAIMGLNTKSSICNEYAIKFRNFLSNIFLYQLYSRHRLGTLISGHGFHNTAWIWWKVNIPTISHRNFREINVTEWTRQSGQYTDYNLQSVSKQFLLRSWKYNPDNACYRTNKEAHLNFMKATLKACYCHDYSIHDLQI